MLSSIGKISQAQPMSKTEPVPTKRHVRASFRDAVYTNLIMGMAETYFCAFMLALGISEVTAGLGTVQAQFIGVLFQLLSIRTFFRRYPLKKRILIFLSLQALTMVPILSISAFRINNPYLVIGVLGLYWGSLLSANPTWNRLMGHTVPSRFRIKFFSIRNQFGQISVFLGLIFSGVLLYQTKDDHRELTVFTIIFVIGLVLKCLSLMEVKYNHNDYELPTTEVRLRLRDFIKRMKATDQGKLISFLFFFYITVHFSAPYFNPFMLSRLNFNYLEYMMVTSIAYFGRVFIFRILQKRAKSRHINNLLILSTVGIATSPLLWALNQNFGWILAVEFLSGCYWGAFELSTILLYYQKIEDHERTSVMTYITFFNVSGMIIGSVLGALFMKHMPATWDQYLVLFAASTFLRVLVLVFAPHVNFKAQIPRLISYNRVFMALPPFGALSRPVVSKFKKKKDEK